MTRAAATSATLLVLAVLAASAAPAAGALLAAQAISPATGPLLPSVVEEARATLAGLAAIRAEPRADEAYRFARGLVGLDAAPATAPPIDARAYLAALAPGAEPRALDVLDALPRDTYDALGGILAAHALAADAVARGAPIGEQEAIRALLIERAVAFAPLAERARDDAAPVEVCGALYLYFGDAPQVLTCDHAVSVGGRGDDLYLNRAGGAGLEEARLAIDLGGNDRYLANRTTPGGINGGGMWGFGALIDLAGDDVYDAAAVALRTVPGGPAPEWMGVEGAVNGGADHGVGLLLDLAGTDHYRARVGYGGVNGGSALGGSGALLDLGGAAESFHGQADGLSGGVNGGANDAHGLFFHCGSGANRYTGHVQERGGVNGGGEQSVSTFVSCGGDGSILAGYARGGGVNGGASGEAETRVVWLEGDATFEGEVDYGGVNGGSYIGAASVVVGGGAQRYLALVESLGGANGGAVVGTGALVDLGGDDRREAWSLGTVGANGGGLVGGAGLLVDVGGDDRYEADVAGGLTFELGSLSPELRGAAVNGEGGLGGCGLLVDLGGSDAYVDLRQGTSASDATALRGCGARLDHAWI